MGVNFSKAILLLFIFISLSSVCFAGIFDIFSSNNSQDASLKQGSAPAPAVPNSSGKVVSAIQQAATGNDNAIIFEFEKKQAAVTQTNIQELRQKYTLLKDLTPIVVTFSDNIPTSKVRETLVFPFKYSPQAIGASEQTKFSVPTVRLAPNEYESSTIAGTMAGTDSLSRKLSVDMNFDSFFDASSHILTISFDKNKYRDIVRKGDEISFGSFPRLKGNKATLIVTYSNISALGQLDLPKNLSDKVKIVPNEGISFYIPVVFYDNSCKTTEAELLPADKSMEEIANCLFLSNIVSTWQEIESAQFSGKIDRERNLWSLKTREGNTASPFFINLAFVNSLFDGIEQGDELKEALKDRLDYGIKEMNDLPKVLPSSNKRSSETAGVGYVPDDLQTVYYKENEKYNLLNLSAITPRAGFFVYYFDGLNTDYVSFFGKDLPTKDAFKKQYGLTEVTKAMFFDPFSDAIRNDYADYVVNFVNSSGGNVSKQAILSAIEKKFGSNTESVKTMDNETTRLSGIIYELQKEKAKKTDSNVSPIEWQRPLALVQSIDSFGESKDSNSKAWSGKAIASSDSNKDSGSIKAITKQIEYLTKQKQSIEQLSSKLKASANLSHESYFKIDNSFVEIAYLTPVSIISSYYYPQKSSDQNDLSLAFDNPVVEREFRARRYLLTKYWLNNMDEAYAFYDLLHALEERRDSLFVVTALKKMADKNVFANTAIKETIAESKKDYNYNIRSVIADLENGRLPRLFEIFESFDIPGALAKLKKQDREIYDFIVSDPVVFREFEKVYGLKEKNKALFAEAKKNSGEGEKPLTASASKSNSYSKDSDLRIGLDLINKQLFSQAFNYFLGLEISNNDPLFDVQKNDPLFGGNERNQKKSASDYAQALAAHYSYPMSIIVNPTQRDAIVGNSSTTPGDTNKTTIFEIANSDGSFETKDGFNWKLFRSTDLNPLYNAFADDEAYYYLPLFSKTYGNLTKFFFTIFSGNKFKTFVLFSNSVGYNQGEELKFGFPIKAVTIDSNRGYWFPSGEKEKSRGDFLYIAFAKSTKDEYPTITKIKVYPKEIVIMNNFVGNSRSLEGTIELLGKAYYEREKELQKKAKSYSQIVKFAGATYSENLPNLNSGNENLLAGYVSLVAKELDINGLPKYSIAPSLAKLTDSNSGTNARESLKTVVFSWNPILPAELNPNAMARKLTESIKLDNITTDTRPTSSPFKEIKAAGIIEPKLLVLDYNRCSNRKEISEKICDANGASDNLLAQKVGIASQTTSGRETSATKTITKLFPTTSQNNSSFVADCNNAKTCEIKVDSSVPFAKPDKKSQGFVIKISVTNSIERGLFDSETLPAGSGNYEMRLHYDQSNSQYELKRIKFFGGSTTQYSLPKILVIDYSDTKIKNPFAAIANASEIDFYQSTPVPLTLTTGKAETLEQGFRKA